MNYASQSPPPLRHPVPTHPAIIPEPPATPGYQRYSSSPSPHPQQPPQQQHQQFVPAYGFQPPPQPVSQHAPQHAPQLSQPFIPAPDFGAWGMDSATAQIGMQFGSHALASGQEYVQRNFADRTAVLKGQFDVTTSYVVQKLGIILFPWRHKPWSRKRVDSGFLHPRDDINAPDLYIPLMAVVTYILASALHYGLIGRFHPQILGSFVQSATIVLALDLLTLYAGCWILNVQQGSPLDLLSYIGYKFVGILLSVLLSLFLPSRTLSWGVTVYFFSASAFFNIRSLRSTLLPSVSATAAPPLSQNARRRRVIFLFGYSVVVQALCWYPLVAI